MAYENLKPAADANGHPVVQADYDKIVEALRDSLTLLEGWISTKCPPQFKAEHMADIEKKRAILLELGEAYEVRNAASTSAMPTRGTI